MVTIPHNHLNCQECEKSNIARVHLQTSSIQETKQQKCEGSVWVDMSAGHPGSNPKAGRAMKKDNMMSMLFEGLV